MTLLFIHARNAEICARDEGAEYDHSERALALAVQSAIGIAVDEIGRGERNAAVEVSVEREDGTVVHRSVVAISVSPLMAAEASPIESSF